MPCGDSCLDSNLGSHSILSPSTLISRLNGKCPLSSEILKMAGRRELCSVMFLNCTRLLNWLSESAGPGSSAMTGTPQFDREPSSAQISRSDDQLRLSS